MTAPAYSGTTDDGASLTVTGEEARPEDREARKGPSGRVVFGTLETPDGGKTELEALAAEMDLAQRSIVFSGDVVVRNSQGYTVTTERMRARLDRTDVRSLGPVVAEGPAGQITADEMVLVEDKTRPNGYVLVFNGSVKLLYQP